MQASGRLGLGEALGVGWAMGAFGGIKTGVTVVLPANALKASDLEDLDRYGVWSAGCGSSKLLQKRDRVPGPRTAQWLPAPRMRLRPGSWRVHCPSTESRRGTHVAPLVKRDSCAPWLFPAVGRTTKGSDVLVS